MRSSTPSFPVFPPVVILGRSGDQVRVRGKLKPHLTLAQFEVVQALVKAGENGLSKYELDDATKRTDARKILRRLANSDPDWAAVIQMPGTPGRRYRIQ